MNPIVAPVSKILAVLTVLTDIEIILYLLSATAAVFNKSYKKIHERIAKYIAPNARMYAFVITLTATLGSLFYSDVAKYTPCILCWWQRIFMYPQTVLLTLGIVKKDKNVADYGMGLSAIGAVLAAYHYYIQVGGATPLTCEAVGYSISCTQKFTTDFGYVTIPMMSLTAFVAIYLLLSISKRAGHASHSPTNGTK
jgi:disulfide bond formation protein DsbB